LLKADSLMAQGRKEKETTRQSSLLVRNKRKRGKGPGRGEREATFLYTAKLKEVKGGKFTQKGGDAW